MNLNSSTIISTPCNTKKNTQIEKFRLLSKKIKPLFLDSYDIHAHLSNSVSVVMLLTLISKAIWNLMNGRVDKAERYVVFQSLGIFI